MTLEEELKAIWAKYEPQRKAELNAYEVRENARKELNELNLRRSAAGLMMVGEPMQQPSNTSYATTGTWTTSHKTWRDELDAELLSAVKRWLQ